MSAPQASRPLRPVVALHARPPWPLLPAVKESVPRGLTISSLVTRTGEYRYQAPAHERSRGSTHGRHFGTFFIQYFD